MPKDLSTITKYTKLYTIMQHFKSGRSLSHLECLGLYGTHRLGAYVHTLRHKYKMTILTENKRTLQGAPYARYHLVVETVNGS